MRPTLVAAVVVFALMVPAGGPASADPFRELDLIQPAKPTAAADFTAPGLGGSQVRLGAERGKVVLLNFWATWCPPCKEEMPSMERLYRRFQARGFTILALSIDAGGQEAVEAFAKRLGLTFPIGLDPRLEIANLYTVRGLPTSFLIDRSSWITAVAIGPRDWDSRAAHAVVEVLLK
jgi:peroxiredoxin